jgi:hypothetical protein
MPSEVNTRKLPLWREIINFVLLPFITFLSLITFILSQIGSQNEIAEIRQKSIMTYPENHNPEKTKIPEEDEDTRMGYRPKITA